MGAGAMDRPVLCGSVSKEEREKGGVGLTDLSAEAPGVDLLLIRACDDCWFSMMCTYCCCRRWLVRVMMIVGWYSMRCASTGGGGGRRGRKEEGDGWW